MRPLPALLAVLLASAAILPGLASSQSDELTLRVAMQDDVKSLNPLTVSDVWSWNVLAYIYDGTISVDPDTDEPMPYIAVGSANISGKAESWDDCAIGNFGYIPQNLWQNQSKQETILFYDFTNVKWHDGQQMDIRDVMFSMHVAAQVPEWSSSMDPLKADNFTSTGWLEVYKAWESQDGLQAALRFRQQDQYFNFIKDTLSTFLLPEHIWAYKVSGQAVDGAKIWCDPGYDRNSTASWQVSAAQSYSNNPPIGNGPFKFVLRSTGQYIKVETFRDHFFRADYKYKDYVGTDEYGRSHARQPIIDAMTYQIFKTADAAVMALKQSDIDYIAWSVPPAYVQDLSQSPGIEMVSTPEPGFHYLAYNMRKPSFGYNEAGEDVGKAFRQAVAHCIDKDRIVSKILLNLGVAGTGPVSPYNRLWYNESVPTYDFNPEKAKQILADAGYKVKKSDGTLLSGQAAIDAAGNGNWWVNPDGTGIGSSTSGKIEILAPESDYDLRWPPWIIISEQLRAIGIYAEIVVMGFNSIIQLIGAPQYTSPDEHNFDMFILGWRISSEPADYLWAFFHSSQAAVGQNYPGYSNASFDSVIDLARSTGDYETKRNAVFEAQASICYDLPYDVLYYKTNIEAYRADRFVGWEAGDTGSIFNWQSFVNIQPPGPWKANARFLETPSSVTSNTTAPMTVLVTDQDGKPLEGAVVTLGCDSGSLSAETAVTDVNGHATVMFTAPYLDPSDAYLVQNGKQSLIQIVRAVFVSPEGLLYDPAPSRLLSIFVFPAGAKFISVTLSADPDFITLCLESPVVEDTRSGANFTYAVAEVMDQDGQPVINATVRLSASRKGLVLVPEEGRTDAEGRASFRVSVNTSAEIAAGTTAEFALAAAAWHPLDANMTASNSMRLYVIAVVLPPELPPPTPPPPNGTNQSASFPAAEIAVVATAAALAVAAVAIFYWRRKKA